MLDIDMMFKRGVLIVKPRGNLTSDTAYILKCEFDKAIIKSGGKYVLLSLKDINVIDKKGIEVIKKCSTRILNNKGKFIIYGMNEIFNDYAESNNNFYQINEEEAVYGIVNL